MKNYAIVLKIYSFLKDLDKFMGSIANGYVTKEKQGYWCLWGLTHWKVMSQHWMPFIRIQQCETPLLTYSYVNVYTFSKSVTFCWKSKANKTLGAQEWDKDIIEETLTKTEEGRILSSPPWKS